MVNSKNNNYPGGTQTLDGNVIDFTFSCHYKVQIGQAIYLSGSLYDLGEWNPKQAIKMKCHQQSIWLIKQIIPTNIEFEYKFFISKYEQIDPSDIRWIGEQNSIMEILDAKRYENQSVSLMSFNLRYQNSHDKNEFSWAKRKDNCLDLIRNEFPHVIGVQEAVENMRKFLASGLKKHYSYIGVPRDLHKGEEVGIFVRNDRFMVLDHRFQWLSESRKAGSVGFDAKLPRYCTCLVLLDLHSTNRDKIMVINTHLDHVGKVAREKGMEIVLEMFYMFRENHKNLNNFFVMGDFNTSENDKIFKCLLNNAQGFKFDSMRQICPETNKQLTFNGFRADWQQKIGDFFLNEKLTIDHIFGSMENYKPRKFSVVKVENKIISDHFPIKVQIEPIK